MQSALCSFPAGTLFTIFHGGRIGFLPLRNRSSFIVVHLRDHAAAVHGLLLHRSFDTCTIADALIDPFDIVAGGSAAGDDASSEQNRNCVFHESPLDKVPFPVCPRLKVTSCIAVA